MLAHADFHEFMTLVLNCIGTLSVLADGVAHPELCQHFACCGVLTAVRKQKEKNNPLS